MTLIATNGHRSSFANTTATSAPLLITADIGNFNLKLRPGGGRWVAEPALVRAVSGAALYQLADAAPQLLARPLRYQDGPAAFDADRNPAGITDAAYLVGQSALAAGVGNRAIVGSAQVRLHSEAYLLLHLYAICASLPPGITRAEVLFAGGLPLADSIPGIEQTLKARLKGTHQLTWGTTEYEISISGVLLLPQPLAGICTTLYTPEGLPAGRGALQRLRFGLDVGGGTSDYVAREGLVGIPGMEGGLGVGLLTAAQYARGRLIDAYPELRSIPLAQLVDMLRDGRQTLTRQGAPLDIGTFLAAGVADASDEIMTTIYGVWAPRLAQGEVLLFGGGGQAMATRLLAQFTAAGASARLLPEPIFAVAEGLERFAKSKLRQRVG